MLGDDLTSACTFGPEISKNAAPWLDTFHAFGSDPIAMWRGILIRCRSAHVPPTAAKRSCRLQTKDEMRASSGGLVGGLVDDVVGGLVGVSIVVTVVRAWSRGCWTNGAF